MKTLKVKYQFEESELPQKEHDFELGKDCWCQPRLEVSEDGSLARFHNFVRQTLQ